MRVVLKRAAHFITCNGKFIGSDKESYVKNLLIQAEQTETAVQLSMFGSTPAAISAATGEL